MLTSTTIEDDIRSALDLDPRIPDPGEIAVVAEGGVVTLRGTVGSFRQRRAAASDARGIKFSETKSAKDPALGSYSLTIPLRAPETWERLLEAVGSRSYK